MRWPLALLLAAAAASTGCVKAKQYRTIYPGTPIPSNPVEDQRVVVDADRFKIAFIEFDEKGSPWDPQQRETAIRLIRERRGLDPESGKFQSGKTTGGVTIIYIHGWKNNAQSIPNRTKDVEKFHDALTRVAKEILPGPSIPLTGIYIGWRGRSVNIDNDLLNFYTIWPRSFAASRVGGEPLQNTLAQLIQASVTGRKQLGRARPRVILIGHSLGAKVLESAMERARVDFGEDTEDAETSLLLGPCKTLREGKPVKAPVDLALLVNEATRSRKFREASKFCSPHENDQVFVRHPDHERTFCDRPENRNQPRCRPYPLFVHVASSADWTTRWVFLAAFLGRTAPHTASLHTHRVTEIQANAPAPGDALFTFETHRDGKHAYAVANKAPGPNRKPIWNMRVDGRVLRSHSDIWNEDFTRMLLSMMGGLEAVPLRNYSPEMKRTTSE